MASELNVTWCPQCGPSMTFDEDGCCSYCGCTAVGQGAEEAMNLADSLYKLREENERLRTTLGELTLAITEHESEIMFDEECVDCNRIDAALAAAREALGKP